MNNAAGHVSTCWKYHCILVCGFWSMKVQVVFQSWNTSPGKLGFVSMHS